ncbi:MAG: hypothetical protein WDA06_01320 [Phenylobacterium sp.]
MHNIKHYIKLFILKLGNLFYKSNTIKQIDYVLFPTLNDRLFNLFYEETPIIKNFIKKFYKIDIDEIYFILNRSCIYIPENAIVMKHCAESKNLMEIIETKDGKKVAIIYFFSSVEES